MKVHAALGGLPGVAGEFDVLLGAGDEVGVGDLVQVLADTGGVTLAGGDDGLQVGDLLVLAADGLGGLVQLAGEDVGEHGVVAAAVSKFNYTNKKNINNNRK